MAAYLLALMTTALPDEAAAVEPSLNQRWQALAAEGRLRTVGRLGQGDGVVEIFEARDLHEAEATAAAHPLVLAGLSAWSLWRWEEIDPGGAVPSG
jgi:uncharacterized protein YciI